MTTFDNDNSICMVRVVNRDNMPNPLSKVTSSRLLTSGLSRRHAFQTGCGLLGISIPEFLQLSQHASGNSTRAHGFGKAKSCIVLFCWGGMSHLDTLDLRPDAPAEVRGEFNPIATDVTGIQISENLPLLAQQTHHMAIVRSLSLIHI